MWHSSTVFSVLWSTCDHNRVSSLDNGPNGVQPLLLTLLAPTNSLKATFLSKQLNHKHRSVSVFFLAIPTWYILLSLSYKIVFFFYCWLINSPTRNTNTQIMILSNIFLRHALSFPAAVQWLPEAFTLKSDSAVIPQLSNHFPTSAANTYLTVLHLKVPTTISSQRWLLCAGDHRALTYFSLTPVGFPDAHTWPGWMCISPLLVGQTD